MRRSPHSSSSNNNNVNTLHHSSSMSSTDGKTDVEAASNAPEKEAGPASRVVQAQNSEQKISGMGMASFKLLLLVGMVLQNSSTVLVGRYTRSNGSEEDMYEVSHLILICELVKFILSCGLEVYSTQGKFVESVQTHVLSRPLDALKISVPALLYLVQNTLLYVALSNLTAPIFQVTYQCKLVTTAVVSVIMLQRAYSARQWVCLVGISCGVAIVALGDIILSANDFSNSRLISVVSFEM